MCIVVAITIPATIYDGFFRKKRMLQEILDLEERLKHDLDVKDDLTLNCQMDKDGLGIQGDASHVTFTKGRALVSVRRSQVVSGRVAMTEVAASHTPVDLPQYPLSTTFFT